MDLSFCQIFQIQCSWSLSVASVLVHPDVDLVQKSQSIEKFSCCKLCVVATIAYLEVVYGDFVSLVMNKIVGIAHLPMIFHRLME